MSSFDYDTIVIGSGAGGLTAAVALAQAGERVVVLEQASEPGGWCHAFQIDGHRFDTGIHYVGELQPGGRLRRIYEGLGVSGDLVFCELSRTGLDHVDVEGERYELGKGAEHIIESLGRSFPSDRDGIATVVDILVRVSAEIGRLQTPLKEPLLAFKDAPVLLRWAKAPLEELLSTYIADPRARTVLAARCGDHGLPPSRASVALHALVTTHYFEGAWYPMGGSQAVVTAMQKALERAGGELRVSAPVGKILLAGAGMVRRAVGVRLRDGTEIRSRRVLSNADPEVTFGELVGTENLGAPLRKRLNEAKWSTSCLSLFAAAELDPMSDRLDSGNIWSFDQPSMEPLFTTGHTAASLMALERFPGHFLTVTSLKDPSHRVGRLHTLEVFAFVPWAPFAKWAGSAPGDRPPEYQALKEKLRDVMIETAGTTIEGFRDRIHFAELGTPLSNQSWVGATRGNLYGIEKSFDQALPGGFRARSPIRGLFLCGASIHAMGLLGASGSGLTTAALMLDTTVDALLCADGPPLRTVPSDSPEAWPVDLRPASPLAAR